MDDQYTVFSGGAVGASYEDIFYVRAAVIWTSITTVCSGTHVPWNDHSYTESAT